MILCSGCFDSLHFGHLQYLKRAERMCQDGEELIVALASDDYIREAKSRRPLWSFTERKAVLDHLTFVSKVVEHGRYGAHDAILKYRPRIFVKGIDWEHSIPPKVRDACKTVGCDLVFVNSEVSRHSSHAISA